jgi:hypothetical protein
MNQNQREKKRERGGKNKITKGREADKAENEMHWQSRYRMKKKKGRPREGKGHRKKYI